MLKKKEYNKICNKIDYFTLTLPLLFVFRHLSSLTCSVSGALFFYNEIGILLPGCQDFIVVLILALS